MRVRDFWRAACFAVCLVFAPATAVLGQVRAEDGAPGIDPDLATAVARDEASMDEAPLKPPSISAPLRQVVGTSAARFIPDISFILDAGFGWSFGGQPLARGGHAIDRNGFALQGLEMAVGGIVDPYFRYDMNFDFAHLHLEEAFVTTLSLPINMQVRAGYMNVPFGSQNPQHLHTWNFVNPPLSHTRFMGDEHFSGLGAELSFLIPLPWHLTVGGQMLDTHPATAFRSRSFGTVDRTGSGVLDGLEDFVYTARAENFFELGDDWSLQWGLSGAWGQSPYVPDNRADLYGTDLYLKWRPISRGRDALAVALTLEYVFRTTQVPSDLVLDHGGFAQIDVQWTRRWMAGVRADYADVLSGTSPDPSRIWGREWRTGASLTFLPTHFSKVRVQYDVGHRDGPGLSHAAFLQLEVGVGEHMAHRF